MDVFLLIYFFFYYFVSTMAKKVIIGVNIFYLPSVIREWRNDNDCNKLNK